MLRAWTIRIFYAKHFIEGFEENKEGIPLLEYPQNIANVNLNDHSFINSCKYSTSIANPFYFLYSRGPPPLVNINFR